MTAVCPNGHTSESDDYCDVCGAPVAAAAGGPAPQPAAATAPPSAAAQACPNCGTGNAADALFCESCGYDFTTGAMPRPLTPPPGVDQPSPAAPASPATPAAATAPAATPATTGFDWVAELWIDPTWYQAQQSPDPLPSPGMPVSIPLRGPSLLVGRVSASRNIHPDIDCGTDTGVSRRQCQLTTDGSRWWVEDLDSANGTFVASATGPLPDDPIAVGVKRELNADDRLYLGAWTRIVIRPATDDEKATL